MEEVFNLLEINPETIVQLIFDISKAGLVLFIGFWLINRFKGILSTFFEKRDLDASLRPFLLRVLGVTLKVTLLIAVISMLGVETTSFIALLGSAGLAVGLALQGSLSNFAGGVIILTVKPFRKGDFITVSGESGTVEMINIFNTQIRTPNGQIIYMPNGSLANSVVTNFSKEDNRRLVFVVGIGYSSDIAKAKTILRRLVDEDERVLQEPAPSVVVSELGDSSVDISVRVWTHRDNYWGLNFDLHEKTKITFDQEGIQIPFPQRDVHLHQTKP
ncbi:MAG: mechanosensitive ion channel [Cyclobacteriaceae bacterium]|nr:mechanosensitive ion channel [Cyclobacteriaceae bacterium]MCH8517360.1 mechanosensitive ion channel [Cyclobacteriaceae bacterium]